MPEYFIYFLINLQGEKKDYNPKISNSLSEIKATLTKNFWSY